MPVWKDDNQSEKTKQRIKEREFIPPESVLIVPLDKIRPFMPNSLHPITTIDLLEARQKKTIETLHAAYEAVRIGGTLGTTYELSTKRIPNYPEKFFDGKSLGADCDEMILAIVAVTKAYGVNMKDIRVLDFDLTVKFKGGATQMTMGHAVAITLNEGTLLFDPAFGFNGVLLKDKKPETLDGIYKGQKVLDGSYVVVGIDKAKEPIELNGDREIASLYYHDLGAHYQITGDTQRAAGAFETAYLLGRAEEDKNLAVSGYISLNDTSTKRKDYLSSEHFLRKIIELKPNVAKYRAELGNVIAALKRSDEALAEFDKAIYLEPMNGTFYAGKSVALRATGDFDKAVQLLESAIDRGVISSDIYLELTFLYNRSGEKRSLERTLDICGKWKMLVPGDVGVFLKESYAYLKLASLAAEEAKTANDYSETLSRLNSAEESAKKGLKDAKKDSAEFNALNAILNAATRAKNHYKTTK